MDNNITPGLIELLVDMYMDGRISQDQFINEWLHNEPAASDEQVDMLFDVLESLDELRGMSPMWN